MYAFSLMVVASVATVHATLLTKEQLEILAWGRPSIPHDSGVSH